MLTETEQQLFDKLACADLAGVQALLSACPAAANAQDEAGVPAALRAMDTGNLALCRWMIEYSLAKLNTPDRDGAGLLHHAAAKGGRELLRYLVEQVGCDPLQPDHRGRTPYAIAHAAGNAEGDGYFAEAVGADWEGLYQNPILPGFRPDPSIVRVGEDYYMVNSSFTWFPAIPISHSRDLVHWEPIGHVLTDENSAMLAGLEGGHGYWAPDISYHDGRFYVTATLRRNDDHPRPRAQIVTSAPRPEGPYDAPAVIEENGIDPSLFVDDDGSRYMVLNRGGRLMPLSADARSATGPARLLWYGDTKRASEGPHLLKKDGWYYLILAEGGTGTGHQISVGRSRTLDGPYTACPYDPILHQYDPGAYIQKSGHGDLVQTQDGEWYVVYLCARPIDGHSPLGRETSLDPVQWTADGWPIVNGLKGPSVLQKKPGLPPFRAGGFSMDPAAPNTLWVTQRGPAAAVWEGEGITLGADPRGLDVVDSRAGIFTRQTRLDETFTATLHTPPAPGCKAGVSGYYDEYSYCRFGLDGGALVLAVRDGREPERIVKQAPCAPGGPLTLRMEARGLARRFLYKAAGATEWELFAELPRADFLSDEGLDFGKRFTGAMMGLYAIGKDWAARFEQIDLGQPPRA